MKRGCGESDGEREGGLAGPWPMGMPGVEGYIAEYGGMSKEEAE